MPHSTQAYSASGFSRRTNKLDDLLTEVGRAMQVLSGGAHASRPNPAGKRHSVAAAAPQGADALPAVEGPMQLTPAEQQHAAGLMRVNHVGEICAQALYRGQALFCGDAATRNLLRKAASEEVDHLAWCQDRLSELGSRPSLLNPFWYAGSFTMGMLASRAGTRRNLGFMAETEHQVEQHLDRHLKDLPARDVRSRKIVEQMREDEMAHRQTAERQGASRLPAPIRLAMRGMSKIMTVSAYRI